MYISMFHRICLTVAVVTYNDMIIEYSPIFGQGTQCIHLPIRSPKLKITETSASQPLLVIVLAHKYNSLSRLCKTYLRSCNEYKGKGQSQPDKILASARNFTSLNCPRQHIKIICSYLYPVLYQALRTIRVTMNFAFSHAIYSQFQVRLGHNSCWYKRHSP